MIAKIVNKNKIAVMDLGQFDIDAILHSGQVFRYFPIDNGWRVISGTNWADIAKSETALEIHTNNAEYFFNYFDFARDYMPVTASLARHACFRHVLQHGQGLRILRGEFTEMVISFILSANNNIKRFTKTLNSLCEKSGERLPCGDFGFPCLENLKMLTMSDFTSLGCGYRAAYLVKTIQLLDSPEFSFDVLNKLPNEMLYKKLCSFAGVGDKVARCVMLFGFGRLSIAPVDTWITKAWQKLFDADKNGKLSSKKMAEKFEACFGEYAGVAQQYIFYYLQHLRKEF